MYLIGSEYSLNLKYKPQFPIQPILYDFWFVGEELINES